MSEHSDALPAAENPQASSVFSRLRENGGENADSSEQPDEADVEEGVAEVAEAQVAFDINDFPGGAKGALEAVLMVVDEPITEIALATALELPVDDISAALAELEDEYTSQHRGFTLRQVGGGWRVYSRSEYAPVVEKFLLEGQQAKLTQASLETLAVIAYRQPISRSRVSAVRGVNVDGVVRTLLARGLVAEVGQDPLSGAVLFGTTAEFLDRMGWSSLEDLPPLAPHLPGVEAVGDLTD